MSEVKSTVQGFPELWEQLRYLPDRLGQTVVKDAMRVAGKTMKAAVQAKAPLLDNEAANPRYYVVSHGRQSVSGDLRRGIKLGVGFYKDTMTVVATIADDQYYGRFVEMGTIHADAHPFMRPALEQGAAAVVETLRAAIAENLAKALK